MQRRRQNFDTADAGELLMVAPMQRAREKFDATASSINGSISRPTATFSIGFNSDSPALSFNRQIFLCLSSAAKTFRYAQDTQWQRLVVYVAT
ncbi:hypothetical protein V8G57_22840 [Collimonas sp. H4R21]|uniref:Uncharacterized protein n=1 Tax=Collimonas rhizosphaerae TaxID=3126357 RepID=A0ABU9Q1W7_9BURK